MPSVLLNLVDVSQLSLLDLPTSFVTSDSGLIYLFFSRIPYYLGFPPTSLVVISSYTSQPLDDGVSQAQPC